MAFEFSYVCEELYIPITSEEAHHPKYLVAPTSAAVLWDLCTRDRLPSIRILDFTESFLTPFSPDQPLPGTPMQVAAPEQLMGFRGEISTAIDIWSFACTAYRLIADFDMFSFNTRTAHLADLLFLSGGKNNVPERFWTEFWEKLGGKGWGRRNGEELEVSMARTGDLSRRIRGMRGPQAMALNEEDAAVVGRLLEAAMKVEPKQRCTANGIVRILENWDHMAADNKP